jgi:hypothetical protein
MVALASIAVLTQLSELVSCATIAPLTAMLYTLLVCILQVHFPLDDSGTVHYNNVMTWDLLSPTAQSPQSFAAECAAKFGLPAATAAALAGSVAAQLDSHLQLLQTAARFKKPVRGNGSVTGRRGSVRGNGGVTRAQLQQQQQYKHGHAHSGSGSGAAAAAASAAGAGAAAALCIDPDEVPVTDAQKAALVKRRRVTVASHPCEMLTGGQKGPHRCHICQKPKPLVFSCCAAGERKHSLCEWHVNNRYVVTD